MIDQYEIHFNNFFIELKNREDQVSLSSDKIKAVTEQLDISEQKLLDFASIPDIEDQLKDRMEVCNFVNYLFLIFKFKLLFGLSIRKYFFR